MRAEQMGTATELLTAIILHPERIPDLPLGAIPGILAQLAATQGVLAAQLVQAAFTQNDTFRAGGARLLTVEDAAQKLGVGRDWLYRRAANLPFTVRVGRALRFSEEGLDRWIRSRNGR